VTNWISSDVERVWHESECREHPVAGDLCNWRAVWAGWSAIAAFLQVHGTLRNFESPVRTGAGDRLQKGAFKVGIGAARLDGVRGVK
jgi:hypothetical protein